MEDAKREVPLQDAFKPQYITVSTSLFVLYVFVLYVICSVRLVRTAEED